MSSPHHYRFVRACFAILILLSISAPLSAQTPGAVRLDIGSPVLQELYVDPTSGSDSASGLSRGAALKTVTAAWNKIPSGQTFSTTGYRINLLRGNYDESNFPVYWEDRHGTSQFPIILQSADGRGAARFTAGMNIFNVDYFYMIDFDIVPSPAADAWHCEQCNHVLLRNMVLSGNGQGTRGARETIKANQSQYLYIEDSTIGGAQDNAIDYVAVQYGHILGNKIHDADDWCMYVKGGSANLLIEGNDIYECGTGGFTAGQGTGFEFMTSPWIHYEAYETKFINNIIRNTRGAAFGVNGGYNILIAHNTGYRVGFQSHVIEVVFGLRSCDGDAAACNSRLSAGGWGTAAIQTDGEPIPNRNVLIYNNLIYNPAQFQSQFQQFAIHGPRTPNTGTNIPTPARADPGLQIVGNVIWNGPLSHPLGIEDSDQGCQPSNMTCNEMQLRADNQFNVSEPQFRDPENGDLRPASGSALEGLSSVAIPSFAGNDREATPLAPSGNLDNLILTDRGGASRTTSHPPGAYRASDSDLGPTPPADVSPEPGSDTTAPTIVISKVTPSQSGKKINVQVRTAITDQGNVASADLTLLKTSDVTLATKALKRAGSSNRWTGKASFKPGRKVPARIRVRITAVDAAGNRSIKDKTVKLTFG